LIRYQYQTQMHPPAPFVLITLRNPATGAVRNDFPAQLDIAADRTVIPVAVVQALSLSQIDTIPIGGVGGVVQTMPSCTVEIAIHNLPAKVIEVVATAGEDWVLLGRDVLNFRRLHLDGPALVFDID
jgi:hypothetical protein